MYSIMRNSTTGMSANQEKMNITSNNIVNSQTVGYKKLDMGFNDLYTKTLDKRSYPNNSNGAITGTGVKVTQATRNFAQGALKNTNINTNLAIDGEGYFRITKTDGTKAYTRNGEFSLDGSGKIVDSYGNLLDIESNNGINIENMDLSNGNLVINKYGQVYLNENNIGTINLYTSQGNDDLVSVGDSLFISKEGSTMEIVQDSKIYQGYVEMSNISLQSEMTDLISVQRAFQFNSKGIKAIDEMWSMINNLQAR